MRERTPCATIRVVADANQYDELLDDQELLSAVTARVGDGRLQLLSDDVVRQELLATSEPLRRRALLAVHDQLTTWVPAGALVFDFEYSLLDRARLGSIETAEFFDRMQVSRTSRHTADAIIVCTARYEQCALATKDERFAQERTGSKLRLCKPWSASGVGHNRAPTTGHQN